MLTQHPGSPLLPVEEVRRMCLLARIGSTRPEGLDHLLALADLAIANEVSR